MIKVQFKNSLQIAAAFLAATTLNIASVLPVLSAPDASKGNASCANPVDQ